MASRHRDTIHIYHQCRLGQIHSARAEWDAILHDDGLWRVHFHADYVPSADWIAQSLTEVMAKITADMVAYEESMKAKWHQYSQQ
jgi:hypothetical protein